MTQLAGLRSLATSDYEPGLVEASYRAFLREEVGMDHMILVLIPVVGAAMLMDHLDQTRYNQDDLIAEALESLIIRLRRMKASRVKLRYPTTYFMESARRRMRSHIKKIRSQVFVPDGGKNPVGRRAIGYEDIEREILLYQISSYAHDYCRTKMRFDGVERDACGYALIRIMGGASPSIAFIQKRYGIGQSRAKFLCQYCEVLVRLANLEVRRTC